MKRFISVISVILILIIVISMLIEFYRPFKIGIIEFSDNLYEKDFIDHSFEINRYRNDSLQYYFSKTMNFYLNEDSVNAEVRAYFNQTINKRKRYSLITIYSKDKKDIRTILKFCESKLGEPNRIKHESSKTDGTVDTLKYCEWEFGNNLITSNYYTSISDIDELYINRKIRMSNFFNTYLKLKFWIYDEFPSFLVPKWYTDYN